MGTGLHSPRPTPSGRVVGPLVATLAVAGVLAGCGSSSSHTTTSASSSTSTTSPTSASQASAATEVKHVWVAFFSPATPPSQKVSLLQNGQQYSSVITAQSKSPLAAQSSASVSKVVIISPTTATVTYTILVAGKPALSNQTGTAVKSGGSWKVADTSFCALLKLQGGAPPACTKA